ncbi:MAG: four helix bundle protein [Chloroflexota bacterium]
MTKIERFEDLQSWQKARQLTNTVYDLTEHPKFAKDFRLCGQIQDAASSVMHNIAEGFDSGTNPEFIRFLKMARRSASEVQSELYLAVDRQYVTQSELTIAYNLATETKRLINGMIGYLRKSQQSQRRTTKPHTHPTT